MTTDIRSFPLVVKIDPTMSMETITPSQTIRVICSEGTVYDVPVDIVQQMTLIAHMIEDSGLEEAVPLPKVSPFVFEILLRFCEMNRTSPMPRLPLVMKSANIMDTTSCEYATFLQNFDINDLANIIAACNYVALDSFLSLAVAYMAILIYRKLEAKEVTYGGSERLVRNYTELTQRHSRLVFDSSFYTPVGKINMIEYMGNGF